MERENMRSVRTAVVGCGMISDIYLKNCRDLFSILEAVSYTHLDVYKRQIIYVLTRTPAKIPIFMACLTGKPERNWENIWSTT